SRCPGSLRAVDRCESDTVQRRPPVAELSRYLAAPRLEVVMAPEGDQHLLWLVLHVPGDEDPHVRQLTGALDRDGAVGTLAGAVEKLVEGLRAIGDHFPELEPAAEAETPKAPETPS